MYKVEELTLLLLENNNLYKNFSFENISINQVINCDSYKALVFDQKFTILNKLFDQEELVETFSHESKENIRNFSNFILENCTVPQFQKLEFSSCDDVDFEESIQKSCITLSFLSKILSLENANYKARLSSYEPIFNACIIIAYEHSSPKRWTSAQTHASSQQLLLRLHFLLNTVDTYLLQTSSHHDYVYEDILFAMKDRMTQKNWKLSPSYPVVFCKLLLNIKSNLNLEFFLPLTLMMVGDFELHYKLSGFDCLHHLLTHAYKSHILMLNRVEVVLDLLLKQLHEQDDQVMRKVFECLFKVFPLVEKRHASECLGERTRVDETYEIYLQSMNLQNKLSLQRIYSEHLPSFISHLGIGAAKHMTSTLKIIKVYMDHYDPPGEGMRLSMLQALHLLMEKVPMRVTHHGLEIMEVLIKLLHAISHHNYHASPIAHISIMKLIRHCFVLLHSRCPSQVTGCLDAVLLIDTYSKTFKSELQSIYSLLSSS